jgi:hypothetical protein
VLGLDHGWEPVSTWRERPSSGRPVMLAEAPGEVNHPRQDHDRPSGPGYAARSRASLTDRAMPSASRPYFA